MFRIIDSTCHKTYIEIKENLKLLGITFSSQFQGYLYPVIMQQSDKVTFN